MFELIAAGELADTGEVAIEEADLIADWQRPHFDIASSTIAVFDGDEMVAYAESYLDRSDATVHPAHRGRGIGTFLAHWREDAARAAGRRVTGMPVPQGSAGDRLLTALGHHVRWTSWVLQLPEGAEVSPRPLPSGYAVREALPAEYPACHEIIEDAFLEWSERDRVGFEYFDATVLRRPGFAPWNVRVVTDPAGEVVAVAVVFLADDEGYVNSLATRRDERGKGLAQALLVDGFAVTRAHGATRSGLSTDSRTGALGLYEKVGMVVTHTWVNRGIELS